MLGTQCDGVHDSSRQVSRRKWLRRVTLQRDVVLVTLGEALTPNSRPLGVPRVLLLCDIGNE